MIERRRCEARTNPEWPGISRQCARMVTPTLSHTLEGKLLCAQHLAKGGHRLELIKRVNPNIAANT